MVIVFLAMRRVYPQTLEAWFQVPQKNPTSQGHIGLGDSRANGCKFGATSPPPTGNGSPPICPP